MNIDDLDANLDPRLESNNNIDPNAAYNIVNRETSRHDLESNAIMCQFLNDIEFDTGIGNETDTKDVIDTNIGS